MGVYVKGMEMPTTCGKCKIKNAIECDRWKLVRSVALDRHRDCPLVPVPPHGRLICADALAEQYAFAQEQRGKDKTDYSNAFMNNGELCTEWWCVEDMLENAPTALESEEGET